MLRINNLKAGYGRQIVVDLDDLQVDQGRSCLIRGKSGSGKTTLLYTIGGLMPPVSGSVQLAGTDIYGLDEAARDSLRGKKIGIVFQTLHLVKSLIVMENIMLGAFMAGAAQDRIWAAELLERLGIAGLGETPATAISQGQAQRVAIARALLNKPQLVLADEPTSSLDDASAAQVINLLKSLSAETGAALLVSSHDARIVNEFDQSIIMEEAA